jgi:hypothetical protein
VALVLMALLEVSTRIAIVQLRGRYAIQCSVAIVAAAARAATLPDHGPRSATCGPDGVLSSALR